MDFVCFRCQRLMSPKTVKRLITYRDVDMIIDEDLLECPNCGATAGTVESVGKLQKNIAEAYRKKTGIQLMPYGCSQCDYNHYCGLGGIDRKKGKEDEPKGDYEFIG